MTGFDPAAYAAQNAAPAAPTQPAQVPVDQAQLSQFDPKQYAQQTENAQADAYQQKYGDTGHQLKALLQGTEAGATLGGSDAAKRALETPEELAEEQATRAANPWSYGAGQVLGNIGLLTATGGIAAPVEAGLAAKVGPLAARALGWGAEGALLGGGNAVTDLALSDDKSLGDPNYIAQTILANMGGGALFGAGLGVLSKGIEAIPALYRRATGSVADTVPGGAGDIPPPPGAPPGSPPEGPGPIVDAPQPTYRGVQPTSFDALAQKVDQAIKSGKSIELPEKNVLLDAASRVDMENPIHPLQIESLNNQSARDLYKVAQEMPGKDGDAIRGYESLQKQELVGKTDKAINDLSPAIQPTADAVEGGQRAIQEFTTQYQEEQNALKPAFQALKESPLSTAVDHLPGAIEAMTNAVPGVSRMFDTTGAELAIKPYKSSWGIDEATYKAVKQAVESLQENPTDFQSLSNIRKGLSQHVDVMSQGEAPGQIRALKASLMDYIQKAVQEVTPDVNVRGAFKRYAINEQERQVIEKTFGASVGSTEFGAVSKIKPENILDRVFGNTANVKAAKSILEPDKFNELLANWMAENRAKVTDKGIFSSNKWGTFLKKNQDALNEAFSGNKSALNQMKDMTTIMRILPDSASINPSGSAKTLWGMLSLDPFKIVGNFAGAAKDKFLQSEKMSQINAGLAGKADQVSKLSMIKNAAEKTQEKIASAAKSIGSGSPIKSLGISTAVQGGAATYNSKVKKIQELNSDPKKMMDQFSSNTQALSRVAPNIAQSVSSTMQNAVQFLASKIPAPTDQMFLSSEFEPTETQKRTFNQYYETVSNPLSAFQEISDGTNTAQTNEALQAVHPQLYQAMKQQIIHSLKPEAARDFPYDKKIAIGKFLGSPLDENMTPNVILSNQQVFAQPNLSQQGTAPKAGSRKNPLGPIKNIKTASRVATRTDQEEEDT